MMLNRGNVRCHFNKGGNVDAERNSKIIIVFWTS